MGLRIAFFGTPAFAVPSLAHLEASSHQVVAVITQPDRARGRGQKVVPGAVKIHATASAIPVLQPERLRDDAFVATFAGLGTDLAVVAAYGKILPQSLLDLPRLGMINVHASLLPRWRGAAPIHRAIIAGDLETGVTIMRVVQALDAGPMLAKAVVPIALSDTSAELEPRLAEAGARVLVETVDRLAAGTMLEEAQDERLVTYAARLERSESQIDWARPAQAIHNQIRGLQPWPLAAAILQGRRVLLIRSEIIPDGPSDAAPGTVVSVDSDALVVAARPGLVRITTIQPEGRAPMAVRDFLNGRRVTAGERFEPLPQTS